MSRRAINARLVSEERVDEIARQDAINRMQDQDAIRSRINKYESDNREESGRVFLLISPYDSAKVRFEIDESTQSARIIRYSKHDDDIVWEASIDWARKHYASLRYAGYLTINEAFNS